MYKGRPETGLRSGLLPGRSIRLDPKEMNSDAGGNNCQQQSRPPQRNHEAGRAADDGPQESQREDLVPPCHAAVFLVAADVAADQPIGEEPGVKAFCGNSCGNSRDISESARRFT